MAAATISGLLHVLLDADADDSRTNLQRPQPAAAALPARHPHGRH